MENNFPENKGIIIQPELERKSLDWLKGNLAHNVANVLLVARMSGSHGKVEYHIESLEQSKKIIEKIKEKVNDAELIAKLDELNAELDKIDIKLPEVDKNLLDSIQKAEDEIEKIIRTKEIK